MWNRVREREREKKKMRERVLKDSHVFTVDRHVDLKEPVWELGPHSYGIWGLAGSFKFSQD